LQAAVYEYFKNKKKGNLLALSSDKDAKLATDVIEFLGYPVFRLPDLRANFGDDLLSFKEELQTLLVTLKSYYENNSSKKVLISPIRTLFTPLPPKSFFDTVKLEFGGTLELNSFKEQMLNWGYSIVDVVEEKGEISFRGDIIDIYPIDREFALRVSLFDDMIESIREFECESQKSFKEELEEVVITPALFAFNSDEFEKVSRKIETLKSDSFVKDIHSLGLWAIKDVSSSYFDEFDILLAPNLKEDIEEIALFDKQKASKLNSLEVIPEAKEFKPLEVSNIKTFLDFHEE